MKTLLLLTLAACLCGCSTQQLVDARKGFLKSNDVSISAEYGGVSGTYEITNGRGKVGVNVDAKQIQRLNR